MAVGSPGQAAGRAAVIPLAPRRRRRWSVVAAVVASWLALIALTGSVTGATIGLAVLAGLGVAGRLGLRALGVTREHPWLRKLAERPWRDGEDVLRLAMAHLTDVFVVTPSGMVIAPDVVELRMNPGNLESLAERMDPSLVMESATEVYAERVIARGARLAGHVPAQVRIFSDSSVPAGRYLIRQGQPVDGARPARPSHPASPSHPAPPSHPDPPRAASAQPPRAPPRAASAQPRTLLAGPAPASAAVGGGTTVTEQTRPQIPVLRLVTGSTAAATKTSGARAGRGNVELRLPDVPTVSREHARFEFSGGRWWITNVGRNGLTLNGTPLAGRQPLEDGDVIRWGMRWNALLSRVEIG